MEEEIIKVITNHDFLSRTIKLVNEYDGKWDATMFMNACVGLLFIATEKYSDKIGSLDTTEFFKDLIDTTNINICRKYNRSKRIYKEEEKNLLNVSRHIRNSIAHCNFEMTKGNKNIVSSIKFQDFYERVTPKSRKDKKTFEFEISMSDFRKLIMKLATTISELDKA